MDTRCFPGLDKDGKKCLSIRPSFLLVSHLHFFLSYVSFSPSFLSCLFFVPPCLLPSFPPSFVSLFSLSTSIPIVTSVSLLASSLPCVLLSILVFHSFHSFSLFPASLPHVQFFLTSYMSLFKSFVPFLSLCPSVVPPFLVLPCFIPFIFSFPSWVLHSYPLSFFPSFLLFFPPCYLRVPTLNPAHCGKV
ncbi:hypothetical protein XENORESO_004405 [Xenotaenia resolanae]|uniref:Uncharacterized protein n=1 Tax=Xenotaenia resolanae TaxID=208358 RepID=A0ABV0VL45_9TELE